MAEYYEEALEVNGGFKNATSAITAALQENQEPVLPNNTVQQQKSDPCKEQVNKVEDDVEMMEEDEPETNEAKENILPQCEPTKTEQETTEEGQENTEPRVEDSENVQNEENPQSEAVKTAEEQSSNDEPTALESVPTVANPVIKPKRSNVRRSWKSPNVKVETPSRSLARRSCNK